MDEKQKDSDVLIIRENEGTNSNTIINGENQEKNINFLSEVISVNKNSEEDISDNKNSEEDIFEIVSEYKSNIVQLKISNNKTNLVDLCSISEILNSFLQKIFTISKTKQKYEEESAKFKQEFYKCKCCDCCGNILHCCCCSCCNYEFCTCCRKFISCCYCCSIFSCCICSVIDIKPNMDINIKYIKDIIDMENIIDSKELYKKKMNDFKNEEEEIIRILESLRSVYINKTLTNGENDEISSSFCNYSCCSCKFFLYYFVFSLISIIHFF